MDDFISILCGTGAKGDYISGSLIWSGILMELITYLTSMVNFERPVSQIHYPRLHAGAPGVFSDLLRSVQMLKRMGRGKKVEATAPIRH